MQKELPQDGLVNHTRAEFIYSLLRLKFSLLENMTYADLMTCKLSEAISVVDATALTHYSKNVSSMCQLYNTYKGIFAEIEGASTINLLLGLYAQAIGYSDYSIAHFNSALTVRIKHVVCLTQPSQKTSSFHVRAIVVIQLALSYLRVNAIEQVSLPVANAMLMFAGHQHC